MIYRSFGFSLLMFSAAMIMTPSALADNLYKNSNWADMASDNKASRVGDVLTVIVFQNAESRNSSEKASRKRSSFDGSIQGGSLSETGQLSFGGDYTGRGEVRRSESLVTQISVQIYEIRQNGDYLIKGQQVMRVNGEETIIGLRGRIRPIDITAENQIVSTRIADAKIDYNGSGFVSRNAKPGIINRLFGFLGLGI